uniref:Uncharacterized protein n=1 Tax=Strombidium inclinatum TaxID=197538 RepID=A0A7S3ISS6_9SPIT|mmetsp:Transcript_38156/g.58194  ORF Transcript_38156/g.58194 Transcript_38156/m.58194 type:complete len:136 (+) Transcript_38156:372-779(+)|eukprot:CAMPEP_0170507222 /NCGR_PEP_ID=MMETSP0208-20121228/58075_1 /TAXON_ID=197538 /ORGANISM="Strombidium inclinatum, Strain S3" /LENGTH=135 /DNA_ID=CAMNT_0010789265 /DNA_START=292 /DNA_END=699 /DNA_ORIENTATION=-
MALRSPSEAAGVLLHEVGAIEVNPLDARVHLLLLMASRAVLNSRRQQRELGELALLLVGSLLLMHLTVLQLVALELGVAGVALLVVEDVGAAAFAVSGGEDSQHLVSHTVYTAFSLGRAFRALLLAGTCNAASEN